MNVKIKAEGVYCLVPNNYEQVYVQLKQALGQNEDFLFTERRPGAGYLQWDLPGDGWTSLKDGDPLTADEARRLLTQRRQAVAQMFGGNQELAQRIMTVPDDGYVYYKASPSGGMLIKLTAWGYRYPERVGGGASSGSAKAKDKTEPVTITLLYDGKPVPNRTFSLNGFNRKTDEHGLFMAGDLPVGYQFDIEVSDVGVRQHVTVMPAQGQIQVDVTEFVSAQVRVMRDGKPAQGAQCRLVYMGRDMQLTTDVSGMATAKVPLDPTKGMCTVSVEGEQQQQQLVPPLTTFSFDLKTPVAPDDHNEHGNADTPAPTPDTPETPAAPAAPDQPETPPQPADPEPPTPADRPDGEQLKPDKRRQFQPYIKVVFKDGTIGKQYPIVVTIGGVSNRYVADGQGIVRLQPLLEGEQMTVADGLLENNVQQYTLTADQEEYVFTLPYDSTDGTNLVTITVLDEKGQPLKGATAFFKQKDVPDSIGYLNDSGTISLSRQLYKSNEPLSLTLTLGKQEMKPIVFELVDDDDEYLLQAYLKPTVGQIISEILACLLMLAIFVGGWLLWGKLLLDNHAI